MTTLIIEKGTGLTDAHTYQSNRQIRERFNLRMGGEAFINADPGDQIKFNVTAADLINNGKYPGQKLNVNQSMAWPRCGAKDCEGIWIPTCLIPDCILTAHANVAVALADSRLIPPGMATPARVKSIGGKGASMTFAGKRGVVLHDDGCQGKTVTDRWLDVAGEEILCVMLPAKRAIKLVRG